MQNKDLLLVYGYAKALWKNFKLPIDEKDANIHDQVWLEMLHNFPAEIIKAGMIEYSKENEWCSIGGIVKKCETFMELKNNEFDEEEIFNEINKAVTNVPLVLKDADFGIYHTSPRFGYQVNFNNLSEIAKEVVGSPSQLYQYSQCGIEEFNTVIASNIKRSIRNRIERKRNFKAVSSLLGIDFKTNKLLENKNSKEDKL